jgi:ketol-acid reductoisomerase
VWRNLFKPMRAKGAAHPVEEVGARLRAMMPRIGANNLVDMDKN